MSKWTIITGGCGYIGSHIAQELKKNTSNSILLIDPRAGELTHTLRWCDTYISEKYDAPIALNALSAYNPGTLIHCVSPFFSASDIEYDQMFVWKKEMIGFINMMHIAAISGVSRIILIGSSSVYSNFTRPIYESDETVPRDVMSSMQLAMELMLRDCHRSYGINSISFRVTNVAGAHPGEFLGELYGRPNAIPLIIDSVINGTPFDVYGKDWETPDSTPARDYVHVSDMANAVYLAIPWLKENPGSHIMNISSSESKTVQELIDAAEMLFNKQIPYRYLDRRYGDAGFTNLSNQKAKENLKWEPKYDIKDMLRDSFKWQSSHVFNSLKSLKIHHHWNADR